MAYYTNGWATSTTGRTPAPMAYYTSGWAPPPPVTCHFHFFPSSSIQPGLHACDTCNSADTECYVIKAENTMCVETSSFPNNVLRRFTVAEMLVESDHRETNTLKVCEEK